MYILYVQVAGVLGKCFGFLALNVKAWEICKHFRERSSVSDLIINKAVRRTSIAIPGWINKLMYLVFLVLQNPLFYHA